MAGKIILPPLPRFHRVRVKKVSILHISTVQTPMVFEIKFIFLANFEDVLIIDGR